MIKKPKNITRFAAILIMGKSKPQEPTISLSDIRKARITEKTRLIGGKKDRKKVSDMEKLKQVLAVTKDDIEMKPSVENLRQVMKDGVDKEMKKHKLTQK